MKKNIKTHEADYKLTQKFLDYANCADASYARLEYIYTNAKNEKETKADNLTFKNKLKQDIEIVGLDDKPTIKQKGTNTAYACAIEARFEQDTIGKKYNNDITQVKLDFELSNRTINFTNRFQLLFHQPNTESGFSATLFGEKRKQRNTESKEISYTSEYGYINYILAIRGTEPLNRGDIGADTSLILRNLPKKQHLDMLLFYNQCIGNIPFCVERDSKEYIESRKVA